MDDLNQTKEYALKNDRRSPKKRKSSLLIGWMIAAVSVLMICALLITTFKPRAVLHSEGDVGYIPCASTLQRFIGVKSPNYFVYSVDDGELIALKGQNDRIYPASTTKLLTILYALTLLNPQEEVTPGNELTLVGAGSSIAYVRREHTLTVSMLIEGMLLPSGNDAAYALAAAAGYRVDPTAADGIAAVASFMKGLSNYAEQIGLCGTHFTVPDGLAGSEHYTTLEDMALISAMAVQNELIMSYAGLSEASVVYASGHTNHWVNTNLLLDSNSEYYDSRVTGLKTGSANGSYNLICTAEAEGKRYIIGLFGGADKEDRFADAQRILNSLYGTFA